LNQTKGNIDIIVAAPKSNGFYNSSGISKYIAPAYSKVLEKFYNKIPSTRIKTYEYFKEGMTFHAKGLWVYHPDDLFLTAIGSSNFSLRSATRDSESQLIILSNDTSLISQFEDERQHIYQTSHKVTPEIFNEDDRKISPIISFFILFLGKRYM